MNNMKSILLQPAYVLHRRAYRESSFLVELFTPDYGRLTVLAKGVRKQKSAAQGLLQPFIPLQVSWMGRGELMVLTAVEANGAIKQLRGECLIAGFYINELIMYLLQKWDAHRELYLNYAKTLTALQSNLFQQQVLRSFEKHLLAELGYGLLPKKHLISQNDFVPEHYYHYVPEQGLVLWEKNKCPNNRDLFSGKILLAIANEDWHRESLVAAKRLTRLILPTLLGTRTVNSRRLFQQRGDIKNEV